MLLCSLCRFATLVNQKHRKTKKRCAFGRWRHDTKNDIDTETLSWKLSNAICIMYFSFCSDHFSLSPLLVFFVANFSFAFRQASQLLNFASCLFSLISVVFLCYFGYFRYLILFLFCRCCLHHFIRAQQINWKILTVPTSKSKNKKNTMPIANANRINCAIPT